MRFFLLLILSPLLATARPIRVCVVHDSIGAGFSPSSYGYAKPLATLNAGADWGIKNVAHSGDKAAAFQTLYRSECLGRGYTHLIIGGPTNNLPDGDSAASMFATTDAIAAEAEADGEQVIMLAIIPRGTGAAFTASMETRRLAYNALAAARSGSTYVDTDTALRGTAAATESAPAWVSSTAYSLNAARVNGGKAYVVTTAGTSAGSGGPTGTGTGIADGSVVWSYAPALGSEYGGATDGLHPDSAGQAQQAAMIQAAVLAAGGW